MVTFRLFELFEERFRGTSGVIDTFLCILRTELNILGLIDGVNLCLRGPIMTIIWLHGEADVRVTSGKEPLGLPRGTLKVLSRGCLRSCQVSSYDS